MKTSFDWQRSGQMKVDGIQAGQNFVSKKEKVGKGSMIMSDHEQILISPQGVEFLLNALSTEDGHNRP